MLLKDINKCLHMMQKKVTEGSINGQVNKIINKFIVNYDLNDEDKEQLKTLRNIKDYNVRKKVLKDLVKKYLI